MGRYRGLSGLVALPAVATGPFDTFDYRPDSGKRVAVKLPRREDTKVNSLSSGLQPEHTFQKETQNEI